MLLVLLTACDLLTAKDYRLVFQLIAPSESAQTDPGIADVAAELRKRFPYEGYSLESEISIAQTAFSREAGTTTDGAPMVYTFQGDRRATLDAAHARDTQTLRLRVNRGPETVLETTVGIRPDQTIVLGTVPHESEAILLIAVRLLET